MYHISIETASVTADLVPRLGVTILLSSVTWTACCSWALVEGLFQILMLSWVMMAKETTMSMPVWSSIFSSLFARNEERHVFGSWESHFHLKVSMTNPNGKWWVCYNHFVELQRPALNLEETFLLGRRSAFCLSLLSIWKPLWVRDSSLLIIPGSSILNFYGLHFAAPEPQYITCTVAVKWELQQGCMSFSRWII